jgi:hypothetical protein
MIRWLYWLLVFAGLVVLSLSPLVSGLVGYGVGVVLGLVAYGGAVWFVGDR